MTMKFTPAQFAAPRAVVRPLLAVCVATALAVALGCGGCGSQTPILDGADYALMVDMPALLATSEVPPMAGLGSVFTDTSMFDDPEEWKEELRDDYEDAGFEPADSISVSASVDMSPSSSYTYTAGGSDFAAYRNKPEDDGVEEGGYRGFEVWGDGFRTRAILEDSELVVSGYEDTVKDVLKDFARGEGFVDESSPLKRALDKAGGVSSASTYCGRARKEQAGKPKETRRRHSA